MRNSLQLSKYRAEMNDIKKKMDEMASQVAAQGGKLTDSQNTEWQAFILRGDELKRAIQMEEDRLDWEANLEALPSEEAEAIENATRPNAVKKSPELFGSLGEQIQAAATAIKGGAVDPRLLEINAAITGVGTGILEDGSYLIQTSFANEIWKLSVDAGDLSSRCTKLPLGAGFKSIEIPVLRDQNRTDGARFGGVSVYRTAEAGTVDPTKIKFNLWSVTPSAMMGLCYFTHEMLRDAPLVEKMTKDAVAEEFGVTLDEEIYTGNGGGGTCMGFMNSGSLITVSAEANQAAASLVPKNIAKMYNRLWGKWRANAVWFYNQDLEPELHLMTLPVGTAGIPVFLPPAGLPAAPNGMLYGKPMYPIENCPTLGTAGDLIFADMSQYVVVEKEGMRIDRSDHVRFLNDEVAIRFKLENGGQPKYDNTITPKKGNNTYSAFVVLATRS